MPDPPTMLTHSIVHRYSHAQNGARECPTAFISDVKRVIEDIILILIPILAVVIYLVVISRKQLGKLNIGSFGSSIGGGPLPRNNPPPPTLTNPMTTPPNNPSVAPTWGVLPVNVAGGIAAEVPVTNQSPLIPNSNLIAYPMGTKVITSADIPTDFTGVNNWARAEGLTLYSYPITKAQLDALGRANTHGGLDPLTKIYWYSVSSIQAGLVRYVNQDETAAISATNVYAEVHYITSDTYWIVKRQQP